LSNWSVGAVRQGHWSVPRCWYHRVLHRGTRTPWRMPSFTHSRLMTTMQQALAAASCHWSCQLPKQP